MDDASKQQWEMEKLPRIEQNVAFSRKSIDDMHFVRVISIDDMHFVRVISSFFSIFWWGRGHGGNTRILQEINKMMLHGFFDLTKLKGIRHNFTDG